MSVRNDKALNASLIAFNNHIVAIKAVVKKAKINEIQKLIRKIKLLTKKKGSEVQLEKNKRKCENLKNEIKQIKELKFNEIALFSVENDGIKFTDYLKTNKVLDAEKISLARIGFNKLVLDSLEKLKTDAKIDGWKRTFIQYKARSEKRKSWKEKTKQLKDIEAKLNDLNDKIESDKDEDETAEGKEEANKEEEESTEINTEETNNSTEAEVSTTIEIKSPVKEIKATKEPQPKKEIEVKKVTEAKKVTKPEPKPKKKKTPKIKERKVKFSDDESDSNESADLSEDELAQYSNMVKFSDDESMDDSENEDQMSINDDEITEESEQSEQSDYEVEQFEIPKVEEKKLKPLIIENKSTRMVIKQLNLDELEDCAEIPIAEQEDGSDDETNKAEYEEPSTLIPLSSDPFFLDKNGREIYNSNFDRSLNESYSHKRYDGYNRNNSYYSENNTRDAFRNKRDDLNSSSFKTSLSSRSSGNTGSYRRDYDRNDRNSRPYNNDFNRNDRRPNYSDSKPSYNSSRPSYNDSRPAYNSSSRPSFNNRNSYNSAPVQPVEDVSKLHPSWQAKKLQEEKLKSMKFEGKKMKFDD